MKDLKKSYLKIMQMARTKFNHLPGRLKSIKEQVACINDSIIKNGDTSFTIESFKSVFFFQVGKMLDSRRFVNDCLRNGLNPVFVACQVVWYGEKHMKNVLENGISSATYANLANKPFFDRKDLIGELKNQWNWTDDEITSFENLIEEKTKTGLLKDNFKAAN